MADVSRIIQRRIEQTKESLEDVDKNIRKLTGRDRDEWRQPGDQRRVSIGDRGTGPGERLGPAGRLDPRGRLTGRGRPGGRGRGRGRLGPGRTDTFQRLGVPLKRQVTGSAFSRLGSRVPIRGREESDDEEESTKPALQSSVVATTPTPVVKSREDIVQDQQKDKKGQARNKRMFGLLLGTLHKFKQEATDLEDKTVKRAEIEQKLEKKAAAEKAKLVQEKKELFNERRAKEVEMQRLEDLMNLAREQEEWNKHTVELSNFIYTKAKPRIFYMPKEHTSVTRKRLQDTKEEMMGKIQKCKEDLNKQLEEVEKERNERLERMALRDQKQREGKENRDKRRARRLSSGGGGDDTGKGKDDRHVSSSGGGRDKRRVEHRHRRDIKSSDRKRRRTGSRSEDVSNKDEKSGKEVDGDEKNGVGSEETPSKRSGSVKEEPDSSEISAAKGLSTEDSAVEGPGLSEGNAGANGAVPTEGSTAKVVAPEGVTPVEGTAGEGSWDPETGKAGEYLGEVHDGKGGTEGGVGAAGTQNEGVIPGIGEDGKDPVTASEPDQSKESELSQSLMQEVDLSLIQLPEGPGKLISSKQNAPGEPTEGEGGPPTGDFNIGAVEEQLDYNEAME